jgi:hypothetical protein
MGKTTKATGLPHKTFKYKDQHPTLEDQYFNSYIKQGDRYHEAWVSSERLEQIIAKGNERQRLKRQYARGRLVAQKTSLPRGTFSVGDAHPWQVGLCFNRYDPSGDELWQTDGARRKQIISKSKRSHDKRVFSDPSEKKILNQMYLYRERISRCTGIDFHIDHTIPISKGGCHTIDNLEVVPARWNSQKGNRHNNRWIAR